jgi:hypothetical protein
VIRVLIDVVNRLEADPALSDLARGFTAETADPLWLLGRQWQLGEHQGEDASSPVGVACRARLTPIDPAQGQPLSDPQRVPAQALVESEPDEFWTPGRRVSIGRLVTAAASGALPDDPALLLAGLSVPYDLLNGTGPDGLLLWRRRAELSLPDEWFGPIRPPDMEPADMWDSAEFAYSATFTAGDTTLTLDRHDGGELDWHSVDASAPLAADPSPPDPVSMYPARLQYPGAPLPRWWQIEDAKVDIGGYPPDRSQFATLLLIDLITSHSDDWFRFPIAALAGHIVTLEEVIVTDSFGETWPLAPPTDWSLFATAGLDPRSLVIWATAATPLAGPVRDEVVVGIDEDANLVWAVERRVHGTLVASDPDPGPGPPAHLDATARQSFAYRAMTRVPPHWCPYVIQEVDGRRRFVQGRAADLSGPTAVLMPPPASDLLYDPSANGTHPVHQIDPAAIPQDGLCLERRAMLARATDASPVLWTQRRRRPLLTPPGLRLRFDTLEPTPATPAG